MTSHNTEGLGSDFSPNTGYDGSTREASFGIGLQGLSEDSVEAVLKIVHATFVQVADEGFDPEALEALLHQVELSGKHQKTSFGLNLGMSAMSGWNHGADPVANMNIDAMVARLREELAADPKYLHQWVTESFVNNQHQLTYTMSPVRERDSSLFSSQASLATSIN
jgi:Zn-dependent M16 (insulinase) family peptidase